MTKIKTNIISEILEKIAQDNFSKSDIGMLFTYLRPFLKSDDIMYDLSNFVTHPHLRESGKTHAHINRFVSQMVSVSENGGIIKWGKPIFIRKDIISKLVRTLTHLGLSVNKASFLQNQNKIVDCLIDLMEETEFQIDNDKVVKCYIMKDIAGAYVCLNLDLPGPFFTATPSLTIRLNIFDVKKISGKE